jgi:hypothetical protein
MDRSLVLYDVKGGFVIRAIKQAHNNAIRQMAYIDDFGGTLITVGNELFAKVWVPSNIYGEPLLGKL